MRRILVMIGILCLIVMSLPQVFVFANRSRRPNEKVKNEPATVAPSAEMPLGRLVAEGPVTVNGVKARTGDTVFPGAQIQTIAGIGATIQIGGLGQIDISPDTKLLLNYDRGAIFTEINMGCAVLATNPGVRGVLAMPGGITKKNDAMRSSTLSACSDMTAAGARSVKVGKAPNGAVTLGGGSVGLAEFGSMMLSSTGLLTGMSAANQSDTNQQMTSGKWCCCCCCCCNPSPSSPCPK
jgi:hypothetical protein